MYKKVGIASLIMMASVFLSRLMGIPRESAIAYIGGMRGDVDAYQWAFILPEILNHALASGFLSITFIPIFSRYLEGGKEAEGWQVFSIILTTFGTLLLMLIVVGEIFTPAIVPLLAPGIADAETLERVTHMTRIILPAQFFFFAGGLLMAVQFAKEKFFIPALAPLIYNLGIIGGGLFLGERFGIQGFSWGVLAGALAGNFLLQIYGARRCGMRFRPTMAWEHQDVKKYFLLSLPLMLGMTMMFSTEVLFKWFGSFLPEGSVAGLNYSLRIMFVLVGVFGQAAGVASYPYMARLAAQERVSEMNQLLNTTLRFLSLVIPFSVLFMVTRYEVVRILFEHGKFSPSDTSRTSVLLIFILMGTFAFSAQTIVCRGYYAMQNTLFPALVGTVAVAASLPVYWVGMAFWGARGLALAVSLSAFLQVLLLYIFWNRRSNNFGCREVYLVCFKMILISIPLGLLMEQMRIGLLYHMNTATKTGSLVMCMLMAIVFCVCLVAAGWLLRIAEIQELFNKILMKLKSLRSPT